MRQVVSWVHQARGSLVVYDRHFLFDFTSDGPGQNRWSERIHMWFLERVYPKPHLVLFLDAPASILYERTKEVPEEYLEGRRSAFLRRGATMKRFSVIDATQPPDDIYEEAAEIILRLLRDRSRWWRRSPRDRT